MSSSITQLKPLYVAASGTDSTLIPGNGTIVSILLSASVAANASTGGTTEVLCMVNLNTSTVTITSGALDIRTLAAIPLSLPNTPAGIAIAVQDSIQVPAYRKVKTGDKIWLQASYSGIAPADYTAFALLWFLPD